MINKEFDEWKDVTEINSNEKPIEEPLKLTKKETFYYMKGALTAGLLVGTIFIGIFFLLLLFCVFIWF